MENYFNYFTEIEEHFQRRWGGILRLSPLDWVLMETWRDAGVPLEAVLRGIDVTFEHYEKRPSKTRKINGLGFCSQEVLAAAEDMKEAVVGVAGSEVEPATKSRAGQGFEPEIIVPYLRRNADLLEAAKLPQGAGVSLRSVALDTAKTLCHLAEEIEKKPAARLEDLERRLTVLEENSSPCCWRPRLMKNWSRFASRPTAISPLIAAKCQERKSNNCRSNTCTSACWRNIACHGSVCSTCRLSVKS